MKGYVINKHHTILNLTTQETTRAFNKKMVLLLNTVLMLTVTCFTVTVEADIEVSVSLNDNSNSSPILVCKYVGKCYASTYTTCMYSVGEGVLYLCSIMVQKKLLFSSTR